MNQQTQANPPITSLLTRSELEILDSLLVKFDNELQQQTGSPAVRQAQMSLFNLRRAVSDVMNDRPIH